MSETKLSEIDFGIDLGPVGPASPLEKPPAEALEAFNKDPLRRYKTARDLKALRHPEYLDLPDSPPLTEENSIDTKALGKALEAKGWHTPSAEKPPTEEEISAYAAALSSFHDTLILLPTVYMPKSDFSLIRGGVKPNDKFEATGGHPKENLLTQWRGRLDQAFANVRLLYPEGEVADSAKKLLSASSNYYLGCQAEGAMVHPRVLAHGNANINHAGFKERKALLYDLRFSVVTDREVAIIGDVGNAWARMVQDNYRADTSSLKARDFKVPEDIKGETATLFLYELVQRQPPQERARYIQLLRYGVAFTSPSLASYYMKEGVDTAKQERAQRWLEKGSSYLEFLDSLLLDNLLVTEVAKSLKAKTP